MSLRTDLYTVSRHNQRLWLALLSLVPLLYLLSGFYSIGAEQRGILSRFGAIIDDKIAPGMHYHLPWPIETIKKIPTTAVRVLEIDFSHSEWKKLQLELTTGDQNLVNVALNLQYTIQSAGTFHTQSSDPEALLQQLAYAASVQYVASQTIGDLLTTGRMPFQQSLKQHIQQQARQLNLGVNITSVQIRKLEPPISLKKAFADVATARSEKQKLLQIERGESSSQLAQARSQANQQQQQAQAFANEAQQQAQGDYERFMTTWQEYQKAPQLMSQRLYLETLENLLAKTQLTLASPSTQPDMPAPLILPAPSS